MDEGDSAHSNSAKIKLKASAVAEKNMFLNLHLYEHLNLGRLCTILLGLFMNREVGKYKLSL